MAKKRIKISAAYRDFSNQITALRRFDSTNQANFGAGVLSKKQLRLLSESLFFQAFREYENYIRDVFILYTQEKQRTNGQRVHSYLKPRDFFHAEKMIKSSLQFLDWNSPDKIIERSELFLKNGFPIKNPYTTNRTRLGQFRTIRNHFAHNSTESLKGYRKVLRAYFGTIPLTIPSVGEYLQLPSRLHSANYHLLEFFDLIEDMAIQIK